jgi:hypothetical protein
MRSTMFLACAAALAVVWVGGCSGGSGGGTGGGSATGGGHATGGGSAAGGGTATGGGAAMGGGSATGGGTADGGSMATRKRIFVTSTLYTGNLGGLDGADAKCGTAADAANLGGTWVAWLSDDTTDAIDRITGAGPWYLVDRTTLIFNNKANLMTGPMNTIGNNEDGTYVGGVAVWTGTSTGGIGSTVHCLNWTVGDLGDMGTSGSSDSSSFWTDNSDTACSQMQSLYCLEQ